MPVLENQKLSRIAYKPVYYAAQAGFFGLLNELVCLAENLDSSAVTIAKTLLLNAGF